MSSGLIKPFFLTKEVARLALFTVPIIVGKFAEMGRMRSGMCHIVILVPSRKVDSPSDCLDPYLLCEKSFGDVSKWPHEFNRIARSKAYQLWQGRNDGQTDCVPHLLMPGDTPWWGGVKREGIVVACSGFEPHFDRMLAGMVADACIALAYDAWSKAKGELGESDDEDFLPEQP